MFCVILKENGFLHSNNSGPSAFIYNEYLKKSNVFTAQTVGSARSYIRNNLLRRNHKIIKLPEMLVDKIDDYSFIPDTGDIDKKYIEKVRSDVERNIESERNIRIVGFKKSKTFIEKAKIFFKSL